MFSDLIFLFDEKAHSEESLEKKQSGRCDSDRFTQISN